MSEGADPVLEAVEALRAQGHTVEQAAGEFPSWLVDGERLTDWEVVARALDLGLMDRPGRMQ